MTKIMLVEDDNNLREIYGARLMAEGYQIVSAADGEEALALAVKEKPELIVADVMMPKISGFDMLDILRTTPETKNTKVIIMTALSQPEDRARGESLGADKYLVKSQVTLEDVVAAVHEILGDGGGTAAPAGPVNETMPVGGQSSPPPQPPSPPPVAPADSPPTTDDVPPKALGASDAPEPASNKKKIIQPINDLSHNKEDLLKLVAEEEAREQQSVPGASVGPSADASQQQAKMAASMAEEKQQMEDDVKKMVNDGTIDDEASAPAVQPDTSQPAAPADTPSAEPTAPVAPPQSPAEPVTASPPVTDEEVGSVQPEPGTSVQPEAPATAAPVESPPAPPAAEPMTPPAPAADNTPVPAPPAPTEEDSASSTSPGDVAL